MTDVRVISFDEVETSPDFDILLKGYSEECSIVGLPVPECQADIYRLLETSGVLTILGGFHEDRLVGVVFLLVSRSPHYGVMLATTESFFVSPEYRKTGAGLKLLREAERVAQSQGAVAFLVSAPYGGKLAEVLPKAGYTETNRVFFRSFA